MARSSKSKRRQKLAHRAKLAQQEVHGLRMVDVALEEAITAVEDTTSNEAVVGTSTGNAESNQ